MKTLDAIADPSIGRGNRKCLICRRLSLLPFRRCRTCRLGGVNHCPTIKAALLTAALTAGAGAIAYWLGGPTSRTVFLMTGLIAVILTMLVNSHANERARTRKQFVQLHRELTRQHDFLRELSPLNSLQ